MPCRPKGWAKHLSHPLAWPLDTPYSLHLIQRSPAREQERKTVTCFHSLFVTSWEIGALSLHGIRVRGVLCSRRFRGGHMGLWSIISPQLWMHAVVSSPLQFSICSWRRHLSRCKHITAAKGLRSRPVSGTPIRKQLSVVEKVAEFSARNLGCTHLGKEFKPHSSFCFIDVKNTTTNNNIL